ncbi:MAG: protein kinase [Labilithrix sp.]|nr:protein kinase [Labilithrix sp.]MCW5817637.1 protein kinase [Labilithrix sp.]
MTRAPREIGGYQLVRPLGEGGMARVYLALSKRAAGFSKLIVLKVLRQSGEEDPELRRMFLDEARVAALLSHPNVVQTYEAGEDAGELYLAMEYLEGKALSQILAGDGFEQIDRDVHLHVIAEGLLGLHYAHDLADVDGRPLHVVHRDVSPQNLFVTYEGQAKLVDFGIAKISGSQKTESGVIKGKVGYIAPELLAGRVVDRRADVFAAGVMIWEALACRKLVSRTEDDMSALARRLDGRDPSIRKHALPGTPPALLEICEKAMAREPEDRYATALELHDALAGFLSSVRLEPRAVARMMQSRFAKHRAASKKATEDAIATAGRDGAEEGAAHTATMTLAANPSGPHLALPASTQLLAPPPVSSRPAPSGPLPLHPAAPSSRPAPSVSTADVQVSDLRPSRAPQPASGLSMMSLAVVGVLIGVVAAGSLIVWRTAAEKPPPAVVEEVRLTVDVQPASAVVTLDGNVQSTHFSQMVPKGTVLQLEAKADGYVTTARELRADADTNLTLALARQEPAAAPSAAQQEPAAAPRPAPKPRGKPKPAGRPIDDGDPYR